MTQPPQLEAHLLVILGEVRSGVKGVAKAQDEFSQRISEMEERLVSRVQHIEEETSNKLAKLEARVQSLEAMRLKVAGFVIGVSMLLTLLKDKVGPALSILTGG